VAGPVRNSSLSQAVTHGATFEGGKGKKGVAEMDLLGPKTRYATDRSNAVLTFMNLKR